MTVKKIIEKRISKNISPRILDDVSEYTKQTRKYSSLTNTVLQTTSGATWVLENGNWVLKPVGKVAEFVNKPLNATYNNLIKPFYQDQGVEMMLKEEKSQSGVLTVLDYTGKASTFTADKKLTEKIEKITKLLEKLDGYAGKIEWGTNHFRDLQQQGVREEEFAKLNDVERVTQVMRNLEDISDAEMEAMLGVDKLLQMELNEEFDVIPTEREKQEELADQQLLIKNGTDTDASLARKLEESLNDELDITAIKESDAMEIEGENVDGDEYEKDIYQGNNSKVGSWLKTGHKKVVNLNDKVKEYSELADMVHQLLTEIESVKVTGWKTTDDGVLKYALAPIIKKMGKRGRNIGALIEKGGLAEDARGLAGEIEKYNNKIKVGSEYIEQATDGVGEKLHNQEQKIRSKEYANLANVSYSYHTKANIEVFEEELKKDEKPKAEVVQEKPTKGGFDGLKK